MILTCKHHDGFCLWPTRTTGHNIRRSSWRGGAGDVVGDLAAAAKAQGLRFGVYLSPWDRNSPHYGTPRYIEIYRQQLTELLTNYGEIFEVWHDGANGGDGFYGGAREKRTIDKHTYYDWPRTWELVRKLQPDAVIFSDIGPDIRWVGNERGIAGDPCWATYDPVAANGGPAAPGDVRERESPGGHRHATHWLPAECDVSIRPGWFWHQAENAKVKTPAQLGRSLLQVGGPRRQFAAQRSAQSRGTAECRGHRRAPGHARAFAGDVRSHAAVEDASHRIEFSRAGSGVFARGPDRPTQGHGLGHRRRTYCWPKWCSISGVP